MNVLGRLYADFYCRIEGHDDTGFDVRTISIYSANHPGDLRQIRLIIYPMLSPLKHPWMDPCF